MGVAVEIGLGVGGDYEIPAARRTTWQPGVTYNGGIPTRNTVYTTIQASDYGNGTLEASGGINSAITACPTGQVVALSAGEFLCNNHVLVNKAITLRGAGSGSTTLKKTNGAIDGEYTPTEYETIITVGLDAIDVSTYSALTANGVHGEYSVTVANGALFSAGDFVLLNEEGYSNGAWKDTPDWNGVPSGVDVWATDKMNWPLHNPGQEFIDDPFPDCLTWFSVSGRVICEIKEVDSVNGNVVTFTTPIHAEYRTAYSARLYTYDAAFVTGAAVENMLLRGGSVGNIAFQGAARCWMSDVSNTIYLGHCVDFVNCFQCEVRHSYLYHGAWQVPGGGGYAISQGWGASENLIEDNIIVFHNKMMVANAAGAGSVVGYNHCDDGNINDGDPVGDYWQECGLNSSHFVGSHHTLFEGNYCFNYDSDTTHGSAFAHTVFRNHLSGFRATMPGTDNSRCAGLSAGAYWNNFVGNVLGKSGQMSGWAYQRDYPWDNYSVWKLGYDPSFWQQDNDAEVMTGTKAVLRDGNYDYVTSTQRWHGIGGDPGDGTPAPLPNSLYLSSKPSWWGAGTWPWVDPGGSTKLYSLPATTRYEAM